MAVITGSQTHFSNVTTSLLVTAPENWSVQPTPSLVNVHQARLEEPQDALSWICLLWCFEELLTVCTCPETQTYCPGSAAVCWGPQTAQQAWDVPGHLTPFPSRHLWVRHTRNSALHFSCGHHKSLLGHSGLDTGSCWGPLCPSYPWRAWYWCFELVLQSSAPRAACTLEPWCPQLLHAFSLIQGRVLLLCQFCFPKRKNKGKKCHTAPPFRGSVCLAQAISVFILYFYTSWTLRTTCSAVANTPINLHSPVFVLVTSQKWG